MSSLQTLQTALTPTVHRRARQLAQADGLAPATWLRRLILVASHDGESGKNVRRIVAMALATGEVK